MKDRDVASALQRVQIILARRPELALHEDAPAVARWEEGLRVVTTHPKGPSVVSDMPVELGGSGVPVTPGWYARAGTAACTATCIAIAAALRGVRLTQLEVAVASRSDARGVLGMRLGDGGAVDAAPLGHAVRVTLAGDADPGALEALVREGCRCSPIGLALLRANEVELHIEIAA